jgi:hypothetical protein
MIKLALGIAIGYQIGSKLSDASLEDILGITQAVLASEKTGELIRTAAAAAGDGVRMLGAALTEEVPALLAERAERAQLRPA